MNRIIFTLGIGLLATVGNIEAKQVEQTICFSKGDCNVRISYATVGENVKLCSGQCQNRSLVEMNKDGWALIQVIGGLSGAFGMVLEREVVKEKRK